MASTRKSYLLAPSWDLTPPEVALGSVITDIRSPERPLSSKGAKADIDTEIHFNEAKKCSGKVDNGNKWSMGLLATFVHAITAGVQTSYSSSSSSGIEYSCESMETRRFSPSYEFVSKVAADPAVKSHLKMSGLSGKVLVVTGVKIAKGVTITTTEEAETDATFHVGVGIPEAGTTVGPSATVKPTKHQTHTKTVAGPIVFAFQVEKFSISRKGRVSSKGYAPGAMLGKKGVEEIQYVLEMAEEAFDEDDVADFRVEVYDGCDGDSEDYQVVVPVD